MSSLHKANMDQRITWITAILVLSNTAICTHRSSRVYLLQQSQCLTYYRERDPSKIGASSRIEESLCKIKDVQSPLSIIEGADTFLILLPALIVLAAYQKLLPIVGLRLLMTINLLFAALGVSFSTFFFSLHRTWTIQGILSTFLFDMVGGGDVIRITIGVTCIAAISPPDQLTKYYNYISSLFFLASVGGSTIGSLLLSHHVYLLNACSIIFFALAYICVRLLPDDLGKQDECRPDFAGGSPTTVNTPIDDFPWLRGHSEDDPASRKALIADAIMNSWHSSFHAILSLFHIPNPTFTVVLIFLINGLAVRVEVLLPQYISLTLGWSLATVNSALAIKALVSAVALFILPSLRQRYLEPRMNTQQVDLFITQMSLVVNLIGMVGLGFSLPAPLFILALCIYTSGIGLMDSLTTYGILTLPDGEKQADFFVRTGIISTIAGMIGAPFWSAVFSAVLRSDLLPTGLPFWLCAMLLGIGVGGVGILKSRSAYTALPQISA